MTIPYYSLLRNVHINEIKWGHKIDKVQHFIIHLTIMYPGLERHIVLIASEAK